MLSCKHITLCVTNQCNANCPECYVDQNQQYFSIDLFKKIIKEAKETGTISLGFSGGEPLLHPDIYDYLEEAKSNGYITSLVTNGIALDDNCIDQLKRCGLDQLQISLDAGTEEENDKLRWRGSFDTVVNNALPRAAASGLQVTLVAVNNEYLCSHDDEYYALAKRLGVNTIYFRRKIVTTGEDLSSFDKTAYRVFLESMYDKGKDYSLKVLCEDPLHTVIRMNKQNLSTGKVFSGCSAGISSLAIHSDGNVYPCSRLLVSAGNAYEDTLSYIWKNSGILSVLRGRNLSGKCGDCDYRYACGGCRAIAYNVSSDYTGEDAMCVF